MFTLPLRVSLRRNTFVCGSCMRGARSPYKSQVATLSSALGAPSSHHDSSLYQPTLWATRSYLAVTGPGYRNETRAPKSARCSSSSRLPSHRNSGCASLNHRSLVSISGLDAARFLQGLITNNVDNNRQAPFYAAFLDARGRVLCDVFVWVWPELVEEKGHWACYIEVDQSEAASLIQHLKRHKLRSKVAIEHIEHTAVWAAWGDTAEQVGGDAAEQVGKEDVISRLEDPRAPGLYRYLVPQDQASLAEGLEVVDTSNYHLQRYLHGIPEGPVEIPRESALPMECNIDLSSGIDFKKGCYLGQELTIRTKHTGVVRKRILPVHMEYSSTTEVLPALGADIKQLGEYGDSKKGRAAGKFVAGVGGVGLALCRLEMMTSLKISAEGGSWKPGMQFGIDSEDGVVKVKPILHEWFVLKERNLWDKNRTRV